MSYHDEMITLKREKSDKIIMAYEYTYIIPKFVKN